MQNSYTVNIIHPNGEKECLGDIAEKDVTYNRYNEGLLIGAGRLHSTDIQRTTFLEHAAKYRNKGRLEFVGVDRIYTGIFCFISFIPETHTVVFGSLGPVHSRQEKDKLEAHVIPLKDTAASVIAV